MDSTKIFKSTIKNFLDKKAADDPLFATSYAKGNKNIDECCNFILNKVQKSGCNGFADEEIFGMAIHYYDEDSIKDVKPVNAKIKDKHIETIEVSLKTLNIIQSRGICNSQTEFHDRIISLVNNNMNLIRQKMIS